MRRIIVPLCLLVVVSGLSFAQQEFRFYYKTGDTYRIISTIQEDILVNEKLHHHAEIVNRISVKVTGVEDGWGVHDATFMASEQSILSEQPILSDNNASYEWGKEYRSIFKRSPLGKYTISSEYFMPVVRDVPLFPEHAVAVGEQWKSDAVEAHDLRMQFAIATPFFMPAQVTYTYRGTEIKDGKEFHKITVDYKLSGENTLKPINQQEDYPRYFTGDSVQVLFWDAQKGRVDSYTEDFAIHITTAFGEKLDFIGQAEAEILDSENYQSEKGLTELTEKIAELGIENVQVHSTPKGLTVSIENIQFEGDSAVLRESEKKKIQQLSEILKTYRTNDLLVSGHTVLVGTEETRQSLSLGRAKTVADYLQKLDPSETRKIFTEGHGGKFPLGDNKTEAGRRKNRRVEITILE